MSSAAFFHIGDFEDDFAQAVPLELWILFVQEDLVEVIEKWAGDPDAEPGLHFKFVTTAGEAKRRMDGRGVDVQFCRRLFEQVRARDTLESTCETAEELERCLKAKLPLSVDVPLKVDYDDYLTVLARPSGLLSPWDFRKRREEFADERPARWWEGWNEAFDEDRIADFDDAAYCLFLRSILEVTPEDAEVVLDVTDLVHAGYIAEGEVPDLVNHSMQQLRTRIELDYAIYGYALEDDPRLDQRLKERIEHLGEDALINELLVPLLKRMGYERVESNSFHGPGEQGKDVLPFTYRTPFGTSEFYAVQAKAVPIHGKSTRAGNAGELLSQVTAALADWWIDASDNERKRLDKFVIATNKRITAEARATIENGICQDRRVVFLDADALVQLVRKFSLVQYVLFSDW